MRQRNFQPALIVHGGAGGRAPQSERSARKHGLLVAVEAGARILREGGTALDAVVAAVVALEDDQLFNAGYGSFLTTEGQVEMDAAVAAINRETAKGQGQTASITTGGVVLVRRVKNPILLARAVMEHTPHVLMGGTGAERLARTVGIPLRRPDAMISPRARERWLAGTQGGKKASTVDQHGTVGAAAVDAHGNLAAATSTGGTPRKLPGRIGDSAILGAGLFVGKGGAASATGEGEAIIKTALCHRTVTGLARQSAQAAAEIAIQELRDATGSEAGVIVVDEHGRFGFAHNADAMEIAMFDLEDGSRYLVVPSLAR
jgi:beta-aspartyl-peptidase (threonine type)